jgi:hypothetical protein
VYHLATGEPLAAELASLVPEPSPALRTAADTASSMPTTLWFEAGTPDQLSSLVTCGRATMCYNLMKHVVRRYGDVPAAYSPAIAELWERLTSDWAEFQTRE